jgi:hypothetical protein
MGTKAPIIREYDIPFEIPPVRKEEEVIVKEKEKELVPVR